MQAKDLWFINEWERFRVLSVLIQCIQLRRVVHTRRRIFIAFIQGVGCEESFQNGTEASLIPLVCHSATVSDLRKKNKRPVCGDSKTTTKSSTVMTPVVFSNYLTSPIVKLVAVPPARDQHGVTII